jgi:hypothetical protein
MRHLLASLGRNLLAGARLALLLPVPRLAFRIDVAALVALLVLSAALDCALDWLRYGVDGRFSLYGAGSEIFGGGLLLLISTVLALAFRQRALIVAVPVILLSAYPVLQLAHALPYALLEPRPEWAPAWAAFENVILAWLFVLSLRTVAVALAPPRPRRWLRALVGAVLLVLPVTLASYLTPTEPWWKAITNAGSADARYPNPVSEPVLAAQQQLLDDALAALEDERPESTDLYFVGFAGDAGEDGLRQDVLAAQQVMDDRWGTDGRSVALVNNPRTLLETPIATMSNLREALREIGAAIDPDQDVVMLYLASRGRRDPSLVAALPPLELVPVTPAGVRGLFDEAGIRWRIVVVNACYSGAFVDALKDDYTMVLTATGAGDDDAGCAIGPASTTFGDALFGRGFAESGTVLGAVETARKVLATSHPQLFVGQAIAEKLHELDRGAAARRGGRTV